MIIWSGRGFLVFLFFILTVALFVAILKMDDDWGMILSIAITGAASTYLGRRWEKNQEDLAEMYKIKHTFFFIPMKLMWAPAVLLIVTILAVLISS